MYSVRFKGINGKEKVLFEGSFYDCLLFYTKDTYIVCPDGHIYE